MFNVDTPLNALNIISVSIRVRNKQYPTVKETRELATQFAVKYSTARSWFTDLGRNNLVKQSAIGYAPAYYNLADVSDSDELRMYLGLLLTDGLMRESVSNGKVRDTKVPFFTIGDALDGARALCHCGGDRILQGIWIEMQLGKDEDGRWCLFIKYQDLDRNIEGSEVYVIRINERTGETDYLTNEDSEMEEEYN